MILDSAILGFWETFSDAIVNLRLWLLWAFGTDHTHRAVSIVLVCPLSRSPLSVHLDRKRIMLVCANNPGKLRLQKSDLGRPDIKHGSCQVALVKNPPVNAGDPSFIPGLGKSPWGGNRNPLQYSWLSIPWTEEPDGLPATGWQRVGHDWVTEHNIKHRHLGYWKTKLNPGREVNAGRYF